MFRLPTVPSILGDGKGVLDGEEAINEIEVKTAHARGCCETYVGVMCEICTIMDDAKSFQKRHK